MTSLARRLIQTVMDRFYYIHHDKTVFENELVDELLTTRVQAFSKTKQRVLDAIDVRIERHMLRNLDVDAHLAVSDELAQIRHYIKGMVIERDETD